MTSNQSNAPDQSHSDAGGAGTQRWIIIGIVGAIILGVLVGGLRPSLGGQVAIFGEIFLNLLKMIVVPLVMLSLIVGINTLGDIRSLGSIGWRTVLFYMITTGLSVTVGLLLVNIIKPGGGMTPGEKFPETPYTLSGENLRTVTFSHSELARTNYDQNWVLTLVDQKIRGEIKEVSENSVTVKRWQHPSVEFHIKAEDNTRLPFRTVDGKLVSDEPKVIVRGKGAEIIPSPHKIRGKEKRGILNTLEDVLLKMIPQNVFNSMAKTEILPLIFFSLLIGAALSVLGEKGRSTVEVLTTLNDAVMCMVWWIMKVAPIGIFGLVAGRLGAAGGFEGFWPELVALGKYSFTVVLGLAIHGLIILPFILSIFGKRNPFRYLANMSTALLNAFSTASSSATLPLTMQGVEEENGISNRTASFVLPLGATVNMDGTALYEAVAAMFIAQVYGIELSGAQQIIIFLTATLAAIGAAGIPEAGLVTMVVVLKAVNLPIEGIGLLLAIDWLLDRFRTTVNVWGDSVGAAVIDRFEKQAEART